MENSSIVQFDSDDSSRGNAVESEPTELVARAVGKWVPDYLEPTLRLGAGTPISRAWKTPDDKLPVSRYRVTRHRPSCPDCRLNLDFGTAATGVMVFSNI